jgi:hypothetical protein
VTTTPCGLRGRAPPRLLALLRLAPPTSTLPRARPPRPGVVSAVTVPGPYLLAVKITSLFYLLYALMYAKYVFHGVRAVNRSENEDLAPLSPPSGLAFAFVLPSYMEDVEILRQTLDNLAGHPLAENYLIVLAHVGSTGPAAPATTPACRPSQYRAKRRGRPAAYLEQIRTTRPTGRAWARRPDPAPPPPRALPNRCSRWRGARRTRRSRRRC